jgi:hypothetical protein
VAVEPRRTWDQAGIITVQTPVKKRETGQPENKTSQQDRQPGPVCKTSIPGSNPGGASKISRSIPETWVTLHSGDMVNSFWPNGLSIGSSLQLQVVAPSRPTASAPLRCQSILSGTPSFIKEAMATEDFSSEVRRRHKLSVDPIIGRGRALLRGTTSASGESREES